jgi:hypothetical protein
MNSTYQLYLHPNSWAVRFVSNYQEDQAEHVGQQMRSTDKDDAMVVQIHKRLHTTIAQGRLKYHSVS